MNSRLLLNIALVIVVATLGSVAYLHEKKPEHPPQPVSTIDYNQAEAVTIAYDNENISLALQNKQWVLTAPITIEADDFRVKSILTLLNVKSEKTWSASDIERKKFGLEPPLARLTINQQLFEFGNQSSISGQRYLLTNNQLFLVDDTFFGIITAGYKNLMRRQLLPTKTKIRQLIITDNNHSTEIYQNSVMSWELKRDGKVSELSSDVLQRFIDNWIFIQAYAVFDAGDKVQGTRVDILDDKEKHYHFIVGHNDANSFIINQQLGLSYQFDLRVEESLLQPEQLVTTAE